MTREGVGTSEGFGAERIPGTAGRKYSLRLLLIQCELIGGETVKPLADVELATIQLGVGEIEGFMQEAAGWAQSGLKARAAMEGKAPSA